jgi:hypothetical protein
VSDMVRVYIEDHGPFGPAAYPLKMAPLPPILDGAVVEVPREQAERWERAEAAWEAAQREMRPLMEARRYQVIAAIATVAGAEAANRMAARPGRRPTGRR